MAECQALISNRVEFVYEDSESQGEDRRPTQRPFTGQLQHKIITFLGAKQPANGRVGCLLSLAGAEAKAGGGVVEQIKIVAVGVGSHKPAGLFNFKDD